MLSFVDRVLTDYTQKEPWSGLCGGKTCMNKLNKALLGNNNAVVRRKADGGHRDREREEGERDRA